MIANWSAVEGDLSRDHHVTADQLASMSTRRFLALISTLTEQARFPRLWRATPRQVDSPEEIARITGIPAQ
ncbi:hypothetical protein G3I20_19530 [Streptomyces sp. SID8111]|uniref:hypothetical protein n=1 Tax=Streptomyces sp. SID8111 TaxID=2706100 RepID=UPI0013BFE705|nr:hypothetical protein [Streptomyces sp. SID8111]NEC28709.1 hypothetical protein [Streptomyces sp. SID8111]